MTRIPCADLGAALGDIAVQVDPFSGGYIATRTSTGSTAVGHGATPEDAVAALRDALEHRAIDIDESHGADEERDC